MAVFVVFKKGSKCLTWMAMWSKMYISGGKWGRDNFYLIIVNC